MFNLFKKRNKTNTLKEINNDIDINMITYILAYEIARSDGEVSDEELNYIKSLFGEVKKTEQDEILIYIKEFSENSVSFNGFINDINNNLSFELKEKLIQNLWNIAFSDGELVTHEERLIRRIADLINLKDIRVLKLKNNAKTKFNTQ